VSVGLAALPQTNKGHARIKRLLLLLLWLLFTECGAIAQAAMVLSQTRVIVTRDAPQAELVVRNEDRQPLLLQIWIDAQKERPRGNTPLVDSAPLAESTPRAESVQVSEPVPFLVDPPVMRLDPTETRNLRVFLVNVPATLPTDRESLFWLNVLEVAAMPTVQAYDARLDVSVLSRVKLFYRPQSYPPETTQRLRFDVLREGQDAWIAIHNPAPVHQTLATLTLRGKDAALALDAPMVAPFSETRVRVPPAAFSQALSADWILEFAVIDDDGNLIHDQAPLRLAC